MASLAEQYSQLIAKKTEGKPVEVKRSVDAYLDKYFTSYMNRYNQILQLTATDAAKNIEVAKMYQKSISDLDDLIADYQGIKRSSRSGAAGGGVDITIQRDESTEATKSAKDTKASTNELRSALDTAEILIKDSTGQQSRATDVNNSVNREWDASGSLASTNVAADRFKSSLLTAGPMTAKVDRYAGEISGYTPGTKQAKSAAAQAYSSFRAQAYANGQQSQWESEDANIKAKIAAIFAVDPSDITTVGIQRQRELDSRLATEAKPVLTDEEVALLKRSSGLAVPAEGERTVSKIAFETSKKGDVTKTTTDTTVKGPGVVGGPDVPVQGDVTMAGAGTKVTATGPGAGAVTTTEESQLSPDERTKMINQLMAERVRLGEAQSRALQAGSASTEDIYRRASQIYNQQMSGYPNAQDYATDYKSYMETLPPDQQMIITSYNAVKPEEVEFMKGKRAVIEGDKIKETAYDLYWSTAKDRKAGKIPQYKIHEKVAEAFPEELDKQQQVLGMILRATESETGLSNAQHAARNFSMKNTIKGLFGVEPKTDAQIAKELQQSVAQRVEVNPQPTDNQLALQMLQQQETDTTPRQVEQIPQFETIKGISTWGPDWNVEIQRDPSTLKVEKYVFFKGETPNPKASAYYVYTAGEPDFAQADKDVKQHIQESQPVYEDEVQGLE